eukprot:GHVP01006564.1.p1 GENE.GHVP01006564.1~~GHVP01006564.1.p1  ORF type:complete len:130 (-),score=18.71 GHVP01006564.1:125-514(-)
MKIQIYRPTFRQLKGTENVVSERLDEKAGDDISDDESYTAPDFNKGIMLNTVTAMEDRGRLSLEEVREAVKMDQTKPENLQMFEGHDMTSRPRRLYLPPVLRERVMFWTHSRIVEGIHSEESLVSVAKR